MSLGPRHGSGLPLPPIPGLPEVEDEKSMAKSKPGSRAFCAEVMEKVFEECRALRTAGQKEYAHDDANAFANFEDDAKETGCSRETVLSIFANKHWRGIRAWIGGHRSQREDVRGRVNDMIVYLCLFRAMVEAREKEAAK